MVYPECIRRVDREPTSKFLSGLDGPQKDQVGWRGYLNPKSGSPITILGSPGTFFATIL